MLRAGVLLSLCVAAEASATTAARLNPPASIAAAGDSITAAFNTGDRAFTDAPANSWSTGTSIDVNSQYQRLLDLTPDVSGNNRNVARSGDRMADLVAQVATLTEPLPGYITILLGANDVCTPSEGAMTKVSDFRAQFEAGLAAISAAAPDAIVFVASIPDVKQLWALFRFDPSAQTIWEPNVFNPDGICQSMLANPESDAQVDVDRRERVRQHIIALNTQLAEVCSQNLRCRFDGHAVFEHPFTAEDVSTRDYFHPSVTGQGTLAATTWGATFDFTDTTAPVTTDVQTTYANGNGEVALTATDAAGVRGIEVQVDGGPWTTYAGPILVTPTTSLEFRAIDSNGNVEASRMWVYQSAGTGTPGPGGGDDGSVPTIPDTGTSGCGCTSASAPSFAAALLLGLALLRRRRG